MVAHCGPSARGEYAYTLNLTDVCTGWTEPLAIRNRAQRWVLEGLKTIRGRLPFDLLALDFDNGGEFINHDLVDWAQAEDIELTRSRPYKSNDNAHIEQKNGDVVRRLVFHYRYDTPTELVLLNELYSHARLRFNLITATKKATGWAQRPSGRRVRTYDSPKTPMQRIIESGVLSTEQAESLTVLRDTTNPAQLTRDIVGIQDQLIKLSAAKTQAATRAELDEARDDISRAS